MSDLIDRNKAIKLIDAAAENWNIAEPYHEGMRAGFRNAARIILGMPSAPNKKKSGKWEHKWEDWRHQISWLECSCCHARYLDPYDYCPCCGAEMKDE